MTGGGISRQGTCHMNAETAAFELDDGFGAEGERRKAADRNICMPDVINPAARPESRAADASPFDVDRMGAERSAEQRSIARGILGRSSAEPHIPVTVAAVTLRVIQDRI